MISEQEFIRLLQKHSDGNCTDEEIRLIDQYLETRYAGKATEPPANGFIASTFDEISSAIDLYETAQLKRRKMIRTIIKAAALLLLISSAGLLLYQYKSVLYNYIDPLAYTSVEAKNGQKMTVDLPDGSVIVLNQNSKLTYSNRFNQTIREVSLTGEGYFRVEKNKDKPFIVRTGQVSTKVLGTSFNIEAYPFSKIIAVELITGKVWLTSAAGDAHKINYILSPNQAVTYDKVSGRAEKHDVTDARNYTTWENGKVTFTNTKLEEVVRRLNITFRSRIVLTDRALAAQTIYGQFGINEQPADVVKAICILVKARYQIRPNGEIVIYQIKHNK
ncbi:FecR domain-containing protein [Mucilaginibacter sp. AW1-3]